MYVMPRISWSNPPLPHPLATENTAPTPTPPHPSPSVFSRGSSLLYLLLLQNVVRHSTTRRITPQDTQSSQQTDRTRTPTPHLTGVEPFCVRTLLTQRTCTKFLFVTVRACVCLCNLNGMDCASVEPCTRRASNERLIKANLKPLSLVLS